MSPKRTIERMEDKTGDRRFGRGHFEIFFQKHGEKLWGISCAELDADLATRQTRKFSL